MSFGGSILVSVKGVIVAPKRPIYSPTSPFQEKHLQRCIGVRTLPGWQHEKTTKIKNITP